MIDTFLRSITAKLSQLWRILGSPRVAGDEKVTAWLESAWNNKEQPVEQVAALSPRARIVLFTSLGTIVAVAVIVLLMITQDGNDGDTAVDGFPTPTPFAGPEFMTEVQALSLATVAARDAGLISQDFKHIARRLQFVEYAQAIGEANRADKGLLETPSETEIWAIAFSGDVELQLDNGEKVEYDNLTVIVDDLTGKIYRVEAFYGEYESEARAPAWLRPPTPTAEPTN
jgi:hypothetical protein